MVDTDEINKELAKFFTLLAARMLERHPCVISSNVSVHVYRKGHCRIDVGDWVVSAGRDGLKKRAVEDKALGRLVGRNKAGCLKVRWHTGKAWTRPYKLIGDFAVRVLSNLQAAEEFPQAYNSYPADSEGFPEEPLHEHAAAEHFGHTGLGTEQSEYQHRKPLATPQDADPQSMADPDAPKPATAPTPKQETDGNARTHTAAPKVTVCLPVRSPEEDEREHGALRATSGHPGRRQGDYVLNEAGKWEFDPELGMGEAEEITNVQPKQLPTKKSMTTAAKPCHVKKRVSGSIVDFPVFRDGDDLPEEVFDTKSEAEAFCARLSSPSVTGIMPQDVNT